MAQHKKTVKEAAGMQAFSALQRTLNKISGDIFSTLHSNNLTGSQFGVLEALHKHGPMCQKDLAEKIMKTTGNITTVIDNLEKSGLVERIRVEKDSRYLRLSSPRRESSLSRKSSRPHQAGRKYLEQDNRKGPK